MAQRVPATLDALAGISGVGAKKLDAYGEAILRGCARPPRPLAAVTCAARTATGHVNPVCAAGALNGFGRLRRPRSRAPGMADCPRWTTTHRRRRRMPMRRPGADVGLRGRQRAGFEWLYQRHHAALYRFVRRLLGRDTRPRPTRCSRTPGCAWSTPRTATCRRARAFAPGCSRWRTTARSTCCAARAAKWPLARRRRW